MPTREEKDVFSEFILVRAETLRTDIMDAILTHCEEIGLEVEVAASLINETLKERITQEAETLNYIEKSSRLPI